MICGMCGLEVKPESGSNCPVCGFSALDIERMDQKVLERFKKHYL